MFDSFAVFQEASLDELNELQIEGEPSFVGGLITDYLTQLDTLSGLIEQNQAAGDISGLEKVAHKLKSSSGALGLLRIQAVCAAIEKNARAGLLSPDEVPELRKAAPEVKAKLTAYIANLA